MAGGGGGGGGGGRLGRGGDAFAAAALAAANKSQPNLAIARKAAEPAPVPAAPAPAPPPVAAPKPAAPAPVAPPPDPRIAALPDPFDRARSLARDEENAGLAANRDVLARRQAQLGGGPGGAFVALEQQDRNASAKRLGETNLNIGAAERTILEQRAEAEKGRTFQREERVGTEGFQSGQSALDRALSKYGVDTGAETSRYGVDVGASTSRYSVDTQAKTARAEIDAKVKMQSDEIEAQAAQGALTREQADKQLAVLKEQSDREFTQNVLTNFVNGILSAKNSGIDPSKMAELLSGLGVTTNPDGTLTVTSPNIPSLTTPTPPPIPPTMTPTNQQTDSGPQNPFGGGH